MVKNGCKTAIYELRIFYQRQLLMLVFQHKVVDYRVMISKLVEVGCLCPLDGQKFQ